MAAAQHVSRLQREPPPRVQQKHRSFGRSPSPRRPPALREEPPRERPRARARPQSSPRRAAAPQREREPEREPERQPERQPELDDVVFSSPERQPRRRAAGGDNHLVLERAAQRAAESNRAGVFGLLSAVGAPAHERAAAAPAEAPRRRAQSRALCRVARAVATVGVCVCFLHVGVRWLQSAHAIDCAEAGRAAVASLLEKARYNAEALKGSVNASGFI